MQRQYSDKDFLVIEIGNHIQHLTESFTLNKVKSQDKIDVLNQALELIEGKTTLDTFEKFLLTKPQWNKALRTSKTERLVNQAIAHAKAEKEAKLKKDAERSNQDDRVILALSPTEQVIMAIMELTNRQTENERRVNTDALIYVARYLAFKDLANLSLVSKTAKRAARGIDTEYSQKLFRNKFSHLTPTTVNNPLELSNPGVQPTKIQNRFGVDKSIHHDDKPLTHAISLGQREIVNHLLLMGADVKSKNIIGETPLHTAIRFVKPELISTLVGNGAEINAQDNQGRTALHLAAAYGDVTMIKALLNCDGADINAYDQRGRTPLEIASEANHADVINLLKENGGVILPSMPKNENRKLLEYFIYNGDVNAVATWIKRKLNLNEIYSDGLKPLHVAMATDESEEPELRKAKLKIAEMLIESGAEINGELADFGETPLTVAIQHNNIDGINLLAAHRDFGINKKDKEGKTALMHAASLNHVDCCKLLIQLGADVTLTDHSGNRAVDYAESDQIKQMTSSSLRRNSR